MIKSIKDLNKSNILMISLAFIGVFSPGALTIFHFDKELFMELDTFKLVLLSTAISLPGIFLPYMISVISSAVICRLRPDLKGNLGSEAEWVGIHCLNNGINYYIILWLSYVFSWSFITFLYVLTPIVLTFSFLEFYRLLRVAKNDGNGPKIFSESNC